MIGFERMGFRFNSKLEAESLNDPVGQILIFKNHFIPGMPVTENIMDAIYKSKKTIVLMSKNFLKSMWGQFELQQAINRAILQVCLSC